MSSFFHGAGDSQHVRRYGIEIRVNSESMEKWMDEFKDKINWKLWLFGHFHADRYIAPGVEMFYYRVENLENILKRHEIEV